jgi:hypothetical protein
MTLEAAVTQGGSRPYHFWYRIGNKAYHGTDASGVMKVAEIPAAQLAQYLAALEAGGQLHRTIIKYLGKWPVANKTLAAMSGQKTYSCVSAFILAATRGNYYAELLALREIFVFVKSQIEATTKNP